MLVCSSVLYIDSNCRDGHYVVCRACSASYAPVDGREPSVNPSADGLE